MPREWTDVLKVLQDSGPFVPFEEIKVVVEHDRKVPLEQTFQSFDKVPLAAASLAQVHKAKLHVTYPSSEPTNSRSGRYRSCSQTSVSLLKNTVPCRCFCYQVHC